VFSLTLDKIEQFGENNVKMKTVTAPDKELWLDKIKMG